MNPDADLESAVLAFAPPRLRKIFQGKYIEKCSIYDFRAYMPCARECHEVARPARQDKAKVKHQFKVFWYPILNRSLPELPSNSIQHKIRSLLTSFQVPEGYWRGFLVQFWAPKTRSNGQKILSVSEQPFCVGRICNGLFRYRYYSVGYGDSRKDMSEVDDPISRTFKRGSPEFSPNIDSYTLQEFPLRNHAKNCGIQGYWALPVYELRKYQQQSCVGVLEFLSFKDKIFSISNIFIEKLKVVGLATRYSPMTDAISRDLCLSIPVGRNYELYTVSIKYDLPRIQVWVPCICDGSRVSVDHYSNSFSVPTHLFRGFQVITKHECPLSGTCVEAGSEASFIEYGKSWVGRAYSLNKICFFKGASEFRISDYPFVPLVRSCGHSDGFAIPYQFVHPSLPPLILELFLPPEHNFDGSTEDLLKSILGMMARGLYIYDHNIGLRRDDDFYVKYSHTDDDGFAYFDVHQGGDSFGNGREDYGVHLHQQEAFVEEDDDQHYKTDDADDRAQVLPASVEQSGLETRRNGGEPEITKAVLQQYFGRKLADAAQELQVSRSALKRRCRAFGMKGWPSHKRNKVRPNVSVQEDDHSYTMVVKATYVNDTVKFLVYSNSADIEEIRGELRKRFKLGVGSFTIKYEDDADWIMISCNEDLRFCMRNLKLSGQTTMSFSISPATP